MLEPQDVHQDGTKADATLEAQGIVLGAHEIEFLVEVLHHPDHEPKHINVKTHDTLVEVLDEAAQKLDVKLLPNAHAPLDKLRAVYEHHRVGEPLDLNETVEDFLSAGAEDSASRNRAGACNRSQYALGNCTGEGNDPEGDSSFRWTAVEQYSLYYPADSVDPLPLDTPVKLHRGQRFEAQRDGKYGAETYRAHHIR